MRRFRWESVPIALALCLAADGAQEAALDAGVNENLIVNGGFESADVNAPPPRPWWFYTSKMGTATVVTNAAGEGSSCLRIRAQGASDAVTGVTQLMPVTAGQKYTFTAKLQQMNDDRLKGTAYGLLVIEWQDFSGKEIMRTVSKPWKRNLGKFDWDDVEIRKAKAPQGAVQAVFGIHLHDGAAGTKGSMLVDDVVVTSP